MFSQLTNEQITAMLAASAGFKFLHRQDGAGAHWQDIVAFLKDAIPPDRFEADMAVAAARSMRDEEFIAFSAWDDWGWREKCGYPEPKGESDLRAWLGRAFGV